MILRIILLLGLMSFSSLAEKVVSIGYFEPIFGHVHKEPNRHSPSLSTISCGYPVKILGTKKDLEGFLYVKVGPYKGYINKGFISSKQSKCIQEKHPKFFDLFNLSLSEMYFWGRLQDQSVEGRSRVQ